MKARWYQRLSQCGMRNDRWPHGFYRNCDWADYAGESLELLPFARVTDDVEYHQIEMQQWHSDTA